MARKISLSEIAERRRNYVNQEFSKAVSGKRISNKKKTRILKKLWRKAKRKYK